MEDDLAVVAGHEGVALELCPACWEVDWNGNGRVDERDRRLLEIEVDAEGNALPEGDPRRRPTFRFDDGDVAWARAFVSFQRAALDVLVAYDWTEAVGLVGGGARGEPKRVVIHLVSPGRIDDARELILRGLDHSDAARRAYLAETDDDREWVPNPRQKSHPLPLPVDQALYDTWESVLGDVRRLVRGDEGLDVAEVLELAGARAPVRAHGFLDLGAMLSRHRDIVVDLEAIDRTHQGHETEADVTFAAVFGDYYVPRMKASPLPRRLLRMKGEIDDGREAFGHKLRYLLWLN